MIFRFTENFVSQGHLLDPFILRIGIFDSFLKHVHQAPFHPWPVFNKETQVCCTYKQAPCHRMTFLRAPKPWDDDPGRDMHGQTTRRYASNDYEPPLPGKHKQNRREPNPDPGVMWKIPITPSYMHERREIRGSRTCLYGRITTCRHPLRGDQVGPTAHTGSILSLDVIGVHGLQTRSPSYAERPVIEAGGILACWKHPRLGDRSRRFANRRHNLPLPAWEVGPALHTV